MFESWPEMWGGGYSAYRTTLRKFLWFRTVTGGNAPEHQTVTGKIVSFLTKRIAPLKIEASLEPIQDLHGQASPYPPGGGKNLLNPKLYSGGSYNPSVGATWNLTESAAQFTTRDNKVFTITTSATWRYFTIIIPCSGIDEARFSYQFSSTGQGGRSVGYLDENFTVLSVTNSTDASATYDGQWLPSSNENAAYVFMVITNRGTASATLTLTNPQFEIGHTTTTYAPYSNECPISGHSGAEIYVEDEYDAQADPTVQISFGSTVYGGTLTVNEDGTGTVVAEWAELSISTASGITETINGQPCASLVVTALKNADNKLNVISSTFKLAGTASTDVAEGVMVNRNWQYYNLSFCSPSNFTTLAEFKTWAAQNNVQVLYKLLEPVTIPLSPGQVNALLGNNTVWVDDSGEIKVTFRSN